VASGSTVARQRVDQNGWSTLTLDLTAAAFLALQLGAILLVLTLLNARDHRRARASGIVLGACATSLGHGCLSLRVRAPVWSRRTSVVVDISGCDADAVWPTVCHILAVLPPDITLAVEMCLDAGTSTTVTLLRTRDVARATPGFATKPICQPSAGGPYAAAWPRPRLEREERGERPAR
jgi:hypothetical protein